MDVADDVDNVDDTNGDQVCIYDLYDWVYDHMPSIADLLMSLFGFLVQNVLHVRVRLHLYLHHRN